MRLGVSHLRGAISGPGTAGPELASVLLLGLELPPHRGHLLVGQRDQGGTPLEASHWIGLLVLLLLKMKLLVPFL